MWTDTAVAILGAGGCLLICLPGECLSIHSPWVDTPWADTSSEQIRTVWCSGKYNALIFRNVPLPHGCMWLYLPLFINEQIHKYCEHITYPKMNLRKLTLISTWDRVVTNRIRSIGEGHIFTGVFLFTWGWWWYGWGVVWRWWWYGCVW